MSDNLPLKTSKPWIGTDRKKSLLLIIHNKDKDALHEWIQANLGISIPRKKICDDHDAPFDFVADYLFEEFINALVLANRSGGKTEDFAALDTILTWLHDDVEVATVGAIVAQAQKCYGYFQGFTKRYPFNDNIENSTMHKTDCVNGSNLQVLPGTITATNSPHPHFTFLDEIDLMNPLVLSQAMAMGQSKNGIQARTVLTSTRKFAGGVMQRMLNNASKSGYKVYKWCIWEVMEAFPKDDPELLDLIFTTFGTSLPDKIKEADGYYTWQDVIQKYIYYRENDPDVWESEYLCLKPGLAGIIYGTSYSDDNNLISSEWTPKGKNGYLYLLEDFGSVEDHPNVVIPLWIPFEFDRVIAFNERYLTHLGTEGIMQEIADMLLEDGLHMEDITGWICDYHGIVEIQDRKERGYPIIEKVEDFPEYGKDIYLIKNYIKLVKRWLTSGKLMITGRCVELRMELLSYKRKRNPDGTWSEIAEKKNDHGPSCLAYGMIYLDPLLKNKGYDTMKEVKQLEEAMMSNRQRMAARETPSQDAPLTAGLLKEKL